MSRWRFLGLLTCTLTGAACGETYPCGNAAPLSKESVTRAPGVYEGYEVSAVTEDRTVEVMGKGSRSFAGARTQCRAMSYWGPNGDGGVPSFTDQDDRCNFEAKLYMVLSKSKIPLAGDCEYGFEKGVQVDDWADMDRAIEIVGAELHSADLGETYVVRRTVFICI